MALQLGAPSSVYQPIPTRLTGHFDGQAVHTVSLFEVVPTKR
jgi:hypothetical protein